jgi:hypothetical protein
MKVHEETSQQCCSQAIDSTIKTSSNSEQDEISTNEFNKAVIKMMNEFKES